MNKQDDPVGKLARPPADVKPTNIPSRNGRWTPELIERIEAHAYWLLAVAVGIDHHCAILGYLVISALKFTKIVLKRRLKRLAENGHPFTAGYLARHAGLA